MNAILEQINSAGLKFVEFALPIFVQSVVLIVILLLVDFALRKKVRAVFRYWIWLLVLVKLVLPPSLSSPMSLGYFFGDRLTYMDTTETPSKLQVSLAEPATVNAPPIIDLTNIEAERFAPAAQPIITETESALTSPADMPDIPATSLSWQGAVFFAWLTVVIAMVLLLLQRVIFVRGLVAHAKEAGGVIADTLESCRDSMSLKRKLGIKISANATSPAVCGLFRPVILVPQNLASSLNTDQLRAVLLHELAHIKRGDLFVNLAQTVLQIIYFYNPLLWLANCIIRRIREQAVDEMVLVAMGEKAQQYPQTLVSVAKLAFKRPVLSLRLIGVVESKNALSGRIKHILNRPMPKKAKLGIIGLAVVIITGAILLPMAKSMQGSPDLVIRGVVKDAYTNEPIAGVRVFDDKYGPEPDWEQIRPNQRSKWGAVTNSSGQYSFFTWPEHHSIKVEAPGYKTQSRNLYKSHFVINKKDEEVFNFALKGLLIKFKEINEGRAEKVSLDDNTIWSKSYQVKFAQNEDMLAVAEVYVAGEPMRIPGRKIFEGSNKPEKLTLTFVRNYKNNERTMITYSIKFQLGREVFRIPEFTIHTTRYFSGDLCDWFRSETSRSLKTRPYTGLEPLFRYCATGQVNEIQDQAKFWVPGSNATPIMSNHCVVMRMIPLGRLKNLYVEPIGGYQGLDGKIIPSANFTLEKADEIADAYRNMIGRYISQQQLENDFKATLPNGVTVELIGICEHPSEDKQWWRPDGGILASDHVPSDHLGIKVKPDETEQARELALRFSGPGIEQMSFRWKIDKATRSSSHPFYMSVKREKLKPQRNIVFKLPRNIETLDFSVGVAVGDWKRAAFGGDGRAESYTNDSLTDNSVIFHEAIKVQDTVRLSATHLLGVDYDCRIMVVDKGEKLHEPARNSNSSNSGSDMRLCTCIFDLSPDQIKYILLQARPYQWVNFKNVSLRPHFNTDVLVDVEVELAGSKIPTGMVGTWFFENPEGDDEQMSVFPDGRVVGLYSNGHRDETRYTDGFIELAEYENAKYKMTLEADGTLVQYFDSGGSLLIGRRWKRIDPQPSNSLLRMLTGPNSGKPVTQVKSETDWVIEDSGRTRLLSDKEKLGTDNWISIWGVVVKNKGRYLVPDEGLTLRELIKAAGYNKNKLAESYVELSRRNQQGNISTRLTYSRNLKTLFRGEESDVVIKPHDSIGCGYVEPSKNGVEFWSGYHFGDVVQLTVNDDGAKVNMFADLDSGKLITPSDTLNFDDENAVLRWIKDNGIDVMRETATTVHGLIGFNMYAAQVDNYFWDASPHEITDRLMVRIDVPVLLSVENFLPVTYLIKTSKYQMGILQILGFTENPKGIKIRYKLLYKETAPKPDVRIEAEPVSLDWQYIGQSIPPDFNDTMILTEHVNLGSIGHDAEGKTFITFIRDGQEAQDRQYRFMLFTKDGNILEPDGHIVLDDSNRLEEKFTFDEPFLCRRLKGFRFQVRSLPPSGFDNISSQLQKSTHVFDFETIIPSDLAPPGRYAVELDGKDDYLLVPDSPSLRLEPPFTIEMWIKTKLPPDASEYRGGWALISKGFTVGTPRAYLTGFGINLDRFQNEPSKLHINFCKANHSGTYGSMYGGYPLTNGISDWIHITHVFDGEYYKSTPGHPLVMGKFLIPTENPFKGLLGEVRLWNGARTRQELRQYENVALTGTEPGLAACWTFEQTKGQYAYDISGNNNHARLGKFTGPDNADPKWIDLQAPSPQPQ